MEVLLMAGVGRRGGGDGDYDGNQDCDDQNNCVYHDHNHKEDWNEI